MTALLEVTGLRAGYGRNEVLHGVDLRVPPGAAVALLGSNGAGKTTLLKTIAGLLPARDGHVLFQGTPIEKRPANARARAGVCLIPEGRGIFPSLSVAENLQLAIDGSGQGLDRVFGHFPVLKERRSQLAGTLSGGEQQMLALARAVGADPVLLMADELSLGLAPKLVAQINETLRGLHETDRRTILMVEQYATHALRVADLVYILGRGKLVWAG
ncbi:MAG TPA: ABC transporter ATP-binding protein, partial [Acidimicrobiia bacterium]|nr:ABC transporter ATP-binding protein [Acidimicrobiia bacterium]